MNSSQKPATNKYNILPVPMPKTAVQITTATTVIAFYAVIFCGIFLASLNGATAVRYPYPLDYGEGPLLNQVVQINEGKNIYETSQPPPYTISNYPPLYVYIWAVIAKLTGPTMLGGRLISLTSTIGSTVAIYLIIRILTKKNWPAAISSLVFFTSPFIVEWSAYARVDSLALCFSLAGLAVIIRWPQPRGILCGVALITASIYTRQTQLLAVPLAAAAWLWMHKKAYSFTFIGLLGGTTLLAAAMIMAITSRGFLFHTITANINTYSWPQLYYYGKKFIATVPFFTVLPVVMVAVQKTRRAPAEITLKVYGIGALIVAATVGKSGSNINYFYELIAAASLLSGWLIYKASKKTIWQSVLVTLLTAQGILAIATSYNGYLTRFSPAQTTARDNLMAAIKTTTGPVLIDQEAGLLPLTGRTLYIELYIYNELTKAGIWGTSGLALEIRQKKFPLIVIRWPELWPAPIQAEIEKEYKLTNVMRQHTFVFSPQK
ncbi:MAG: hypothetical protein COT71_02580 [Candidatus Andersenbacteria bacterium CG10_big_fil_rev_8_21_14_0_10_54_11]|uniref:Glycosyltransferase RgtA/B/C/D-like domain-containing protein n=1 Tax=Candidatus Andersenbacteria bacterium CG10_big_fil_rev_8_21_14_0_10_54_11 TaxID=1974485 RepID=A0A2M6WZ80_9BACT|nr:MAG: hypothetical protein COT71_02580 [Candidatus Andersenbacteria bacterium CG10_big_fil_rev_8_21_14_0_10_54_11]